MGQSNETMHINTMTNFTVQFSPQKEIHCSEVIVKF